MDKMKLLNETFKLSNGIDIPCVGFGTWQAPDGKTAVESVLDPDKRDF